MTAKDVWDTVNTVDGKGIEKGTRVVLEACLRNVDTFGSVIECAIKLDKVHND